MAKVGHRNWERSTWRWGRGGAVWAAFGLMVLVAAAAGLTGAAEKVPAQQGNGGALSEHGQKSAAGQSGTSAKPSQPASPSGSGATPVATPPAAAPQPVLPLTSDQIAGHMGETVDWFHHLAAMEQLQIAATDSASRDKLHQESLTAVELAFDFGKACAALLNAQSRQLAQAAQAAAQSGQSAPSATATTPASKGMAGRLDQAAANISQSITTLQAQLDTLNDQIAHARKQERETLVAQQGQVTAALRLAREVQSSVQDMENFEASSIAGDNGNLSPLEGQIADMERSVPEAHVGLATGSQGTGAASGGGSGGGTRRSSPGGSGGADGSGGSGGAGSGGGASGGASTGGSGGTAGRSANNTASSGSANSAAGSTAGSSAQPPANTFRAESAGVIALVTEWFSLHNMRSQLADSIKETSDLQAGDREGAHGFDERGSYGRG